MNNPFLIGKRVYLRSLTLEDNYVSWLNDTDVCKGNSHHVFPHTREDEVDYIVDSCGLDNKIVLAIVLKRGDIHIGNVSLQNIDFKNQCAEFAILMGNKRYWGQGYGREAGDLIVKHGFEQLNLRRIYCGTFAENSAMRELAEYLGMQEEGVRKKAFYKNGKFVNIVEYGMVK